MGRWGECGNLASPIERLWSALFSFSIIASVLALMANRMNSAAMAP
jgi:hypothetical protein